MLRGFNDSARPAGRRIAAMRASLAFLLCALLIVGSLATATEHPTSSRYPTIVIYVGSG